MTLFVADNKCKRVWDHPIKLFVTIWPVKAIACQRVIFPRFMTFRLMHIHCVVMCDMTSAF